MKDNIKDSLNMKYINKTFILLFLELLFLISFNSSAKDEVLNLKYKVYNSGNTTLFPVTSTLIEGEKELILVDAQFQKNDAKILVDAIEKSGKKLKLIYISQSDPDYYFGLEVLHNSFPNVKIVSTLQTADLIKITHEQKLKYWAEKLKETSPDNIIIPEGITDKYLELEGNKIYINQDQDYPDRSYLWDPQTKTILGGNLLTYGSYIWLADSQSLQDLENWISQLKKMQKLKANTVIPGHYLNIINADEFTSDIINFNLDYLTKALKAYKQSRNSKEFVEIIKKDFPNLQEESVLEFSAKVLKGEEKWPVVRSYPNLKYYKIHKN